MRCKKAVRKGAMTAEDVERAALEQITRIVERYAEKSGLALQPDPVELGYVLNGLARNLTKTPHSPHKTGSSCIGENSRTVAQCGTLQARCWCGPEDVKMLYTCFRPGCIIIAGPGRVLDPGVSGGRAAFLAWEKGEGKVAPSQGY